LLEPSDPKAELRNLMNASEYAEFLKGLK